MRHPVVFLLLGALFGFVLSRAGATDPQIVAQLFLFQNVHLLWVILVAVIVGGIGTQVMKRRQIAALGETSPIQFEGKPWTKGLVVGALLFGVGWGLTGVCPGTATTMIGEGKFFVLFTLVGVLAGTWLNGWWRSRKGG